MNTQNALNLILTGLCAAIGAALIAVGSFDTTDSTAIRAGLIALGLILCAFGGTAFVLAERHRLGLCKCPKTHE